MKDGTGNAACVQADRRLERLRRVTFDAGIDTLYLRIWAGKCVSQQRLQGYARKCMAGAGAVFVAQDTPDLMLSAHDETRNAWTMVIQNPSQVTLRSIIEMDLGCDKIDPAVIRQIDIRLDAKPANFDPELGLAVVQDMKNAIIVPDYDGKPWREHVGQNGSLTAYQGNYDKTEKLVKVRKWQVCAYWKLKDQGRELKPKERRARIEYRVGADGLARIGFDGLCAEDFVSCPETVAEIAHLFQFREPELNKRARRALQSDRIKF